MVALARQCSAEQGDSAGIDTHINEASAGLVDRLNPPRCRAGAAKSLDSFRGRQTRYLSCAVILNLRSRNGPAHRRPLPQCLSVAPGRPGFRLAAQQAGRLGGGRMGIGKSKARRYDQETDAKVTFDDVAGIDETENGLVEIVDSSRTPRSTRAWRLRKACCWSARQEPERPCCQRRS